MANDLVMKIIMNAQDKASAAMQRVRNASHGLSGSLNELEKELRGLDKAQKMILQRNDLSKKMTENSRAMMENLKAQRLLSDEIARAGTPTKAQAAKMEELKNAGARLREVQDKNTNKLNELNQKLKQAGISAKTFAAAQEQLNQKHQVATAAAEKQRAALERLTRAQNLTNRARNISGSLQGKAAGAAMGATAIGGALSVPVRAYAEAESAGTELRVAMMDNTGKVLPEYEKVDALAVSLGDRLPGTTADFKALMTTLVRQGVSAQTILGGTGEAAALLAVQLKKPPAEAAEMAAKLQDATRSSEKEMMGLMDRVQKLYYMGVDDNNILGAFSKLSPALDITKMRGEQAIKTFSPLIGMLDQAGLSGESAGNALRKVFSSAMDTQKVKKATKGTGIDLQFTDGKGEFGGLENMYTQLAKLQKLDTETRLQVLKGIFGDDAETLQALNTMIEKGQQGYNEFAAKMDKQASLQQRVNETLGTVANLWDSATGSFTNFMVAIGAAIAPEIRQIVEWIDIVTTKLGAWAAANPQTANTILKVIAAIGAGLAVFAALSAVVSAVLVPMALMKLSWVTLATSWGQGLGMIGKVATALRGLGVALLGFGRTAVMFLFTNPFGWAILAVGALYLLWRNWDKVKSALITGWNYIKQAFRQNPLLSVFVGPIGSMLAFIANWDRVKAALIAGWQAISARFMNNPVVRFAVQSTSAVQKFAAIFGGIPGIVSAILGVAGAHLGAAIASMGAKIRGFSPSSIFQAIFSAALGYLRGLGGQMAAAGAAMIEGLISGIKSRIGAVSGYLSQLRGMVSNFKMPTLPTIKPVGFSRGGYTGAGGVNETAGIVHRGEVVFSQRDVARFGGWRVVDALRKGGLNALERVSGSLKIGNSLGDNDRPKLSGAIAKPKAFAPSFSANSGSLNRGGDNIVINVHAAPNMDIRQLAEMIMQKLQRQQHKQQIRANSGFFDKD